MHEKNPVCADINECHSDPCMNGATCEDGVFQYTCDCVDGYTGTHCETGVYYMSLVLLLYAVNGFPCICLKLYTLFSLTYKIQ